MYIVNLTENEFLEWSIESLGVDEIENRVSVTFFGQPDEAKVRKFRTHVSDSPLIVFDFSWTTYPPQKSLRLPFVNRWHSWLTKMRYIRLSLVVWYLAIGESK